MRLLQNLCFIVLSISSVFSQPFFVSVDIQPAPLIEWDQQPTVFYTGQALNTTWRSEGFQPTDLARITYPGSGGTRTLTTGSLINASSYKIRLSDSGNGVATNVPVTVAHSTNTTNAKASTQLITVIQSKIQSIVPFDGTRTLGGGQNTVCDDRNLTVTWRGLGESQFGVATVSLNRQGGAGGSSSLGTPLTNIPTSGNMTVVFLCPRTSTPSTFFAYAFQISVVEPGGSPYTGTSASFNVAVAPTPTPSPTSSPTPSKTMTPSPSPSNTPTPTPSLTPSVSQSNTPTSSVTVSRTPTPSTTETARPSIDYLAIGRAAADQVDTKTPAIAGALGGIGGMLLLFGAFKWYQQKLMTEKRKQKLAMSMRFVQQANASYGIQSSSEPSIVMYTVASTESLKKGFAPKSTSK